MNIKKNHTVFSLILSFLWFGILCAQSPELTSRELYQDFVSTIKKNHLETDYLLNKGFIEEDEIESLYQFIEGFDEETQEIVPPVSNINGESWIRLYRQILESEFHPETPLPTIDQISNSLDQETFTSTDIPIVFFDIKGELLSEDEIDAAIYDNQKLQPYHMIHLFGATSYITNFYEKNISFKLDKENYFSGSKSEPTEILIDFSDGRGINSYDLNSPNSINVSYADLGEKVITVYRDAVLNGNNMRIGSSFVINIESDNTKTPSTIIESSSISARSADGSPIITSGAKAYCYFGNDNVLDKPVIIVQGFDPIGDITLESQRRKYEAFENALTVNNDLDLVFVLLDNTNLSLQNNTRILKNIIRQINQRKQGNFDSVIIGESMGGLLSRMALKQFENENYDHNVGLYISFDAPHQGANLPPGIQHLAKDVLSSRTALAGKALLGLLDKTVIKLIRLFNSKTSDLRETLQINTAYQALGALNSEAAKSMLVRHISGNNNFNVTQNMLENLGYPEETRNIALINGSNESTDLQQRFSGGNLVPGEKLIEINVLKSQCNDFSLSAWSSPTNRRAKVSRFKLRLGVKIPVIRIRWEARCIVRLFGKCRLKTHVPVKVKVGVQCVTNDFINKEKFYNFDGASYDNAPGSTLAGINSTPVDVSSNIAFVPTASAIDISEDAYNPTTDPAGLRAITNNRVLDNFIRNDLTPFDEVYSKATNSDHVFFDFADAQNFQNIIDDEIMPVNLNMQNKHIKLNRDFEATRDIVMGNNVNPVARKIIEPGNIIIDNNAKVSFRAGNEIVLANGTFVKKGSNVVFSIQPTPSARRSKSKPLNDYFNIKILGKKDYNIGEYPAFKVITSNPDSDYDIDWKVERQEGLKERGNEFIIRDLLYPGSYLLKVKVTSRKTGAAKSLTKVFNILNKSEEYTKPINENILKNYENFKLYPNPTRGETTVISSNAIKEILVYTIAGEKLVQKHSSNERNWFSLDLSTYPNGIYIVRVVYQNNKTLEKKIIKR